MSKELKPQSSNWEEGMRKGLRELLISLDDLHVDKFSPSLPFKGDIYFDGIEVEQWLTNFISHLLASEKSRLVEEVKKLERLIPICTDDCPFCGRGLQRKCNAYALDKEYNEALDKVLEIISK